MRKLGYLVAAFAIATAMFWATMLSDPPKTEAALPTEGPSACAAAGQSLSPWFESELSRRAWSRPTPHDDFQLALTWFRAAQRQCAGGEWQRAEANLRVIQGMIARIDTRRRIEDER